MRPLRRRDLLRCFLRGLCLQGAWSFRGMQSVGFAHAMEPALRRLHEDTAGRGAALARHVEFFNTHPVLACAILGCAIRVEADGADGPEQVAAEVARVKGALMGAYGALGDTFYWGALKPLLAVLAVGAAYRGVGWAPWAYLGVFLAGNLAGRCYGFWHGYRHGVGVVDALARLRLPALAARLKAAAVLALGVAVAGAVGATPLPAWGVPVWAAAATAGTLALCLAPLLDRGLRAGWLIYAVLALAVGVTVWT